MHCASCDTLKSDSALVTNLVRLATCATGNPGAWRLYTNHVEYSAINDGALPARIRPGLRYTTLRHRR